MFTRPNASDPLQMARAMSGKTRRSACGLLGALGIGRPHEGAVGGAPQEARIDERIEQCLRRDRVESPEAAGLRRGQAEARHFAKLSLHALQRLLDRVDALVSHTPPPSTPIALGECARMSKLR